MTAKYNLFLLFILTFSFRGTAQMVTGTDTLVGNEWIRYDHPYYSFSVEADGICRIPYAAMQNAGMGPSITGSDIRLFSLGQQVPVYLSTEGIFQDGDFIEFYGYQNRGELDRFLFLHPDEDQLNPEFSMYTDKRPYFLTLADDEPQVKVEVLPNDLSAPPSPELFYLHTETSLFTSSSNDLYYTVAGGGAVSYSSYLHSEGFCKNSEPHSTTTINSLHRAASGPDASLRIRMTSTNYGNHAWVITWNDQTMDTVRLEAILTLDTTYAIPLQQLQDQNQLKLTAINAQSRHALVQVDLTYPRTFQMDGADASSLLLANESGPHYVMLDQFTHDGLPPVIYTANGTKRLTTAIDGNNQVHWVWPATEATTPFHIGNASTSIRIINELTEKRFKNLKDDNTEYVVITHPDLMPTGTESEYIKYRSSAAGGGYRAEAYSILDLYDQFSYGVEKHPLAIRNFVEYMHRHWPDAKMIFIIGRAIEYHRSRFPGSEADSLFFVPTYGRPGADNLLAATLWDLVPRYPIGRLAVFNPQDIGHYLNKVKEHDQVIQTGQTIEEKGWIKNVMHIGGGKTQTEQQDFKLTLESLGADLAKSDFGATLSYFQKESTDPVAESQSNQVLRQLREGCSIVNYLGHSSASTFEFNISGPVEWNNKGRYPVFSAMGCSAGHIHSNVFSLSDAYVQTPEEGAIAFISGSGSQFANALVSWARPWYEYLGTLHYGATLGESTLAGLQGVSQFVNVDNPGSNSYRYLLEQQTLQGDPAIRLHPLPGPDYTIDPSSVSIYPQVLNARLDSFDLNFTITNIGRNLRQNVPYVIRLVSAEGEITMLQTGAALCGTFETPLHLRLPLATGGKSGLYRLQITVDHPQLIDELPNPAAEQNNTLKDNLGVEGISIVIADDLFSAVYPADFAIVTEDQPIFIATASDGFAQGQDVVIQLDTNALFSSPALVTEKMLNMDGPLQWQVQVPLQIGQEYFWRVSTDSVSPTQGYNWSSRSFLYWPGSFPGWNQSHFHQLTANSLQQMKADSTGHAFDFANTTINFRNTNRVQNNDLALFPLMIVDGVIRTAFYTGFNTQDVNLFVVAIDPVTGDYIRNPNPGLYGSVNHLNFDAPCFAFSTATPESRQNIINFVKDHIPAGHYVFIYSYQRPGRMDYFPEQWADDEAIYGQSIFSMIEDQYPGSSIRSLAETGSQPFIFLCRKDMGVIEENIAKDVEEVINVNFDSPVRLTDGRMTTGLIGPSRVWYSIDNALSNRPDTSGSWSLSAWALNATLTDTLWILRDSVTTFTSLSHINAEAYPFIQLQYKTQDPQARTPSLVDKWRVFYDGYSDIILRPDLGFQFDRDTLVRGETFRFRSIVQNAGPDLIDSVLVRYKITDRSNQTLVKEQMLYEMKSWDTAEVQLIMNTKELSGDYQFLIEVNPHRDPFELSYANNIGTKSFHVIGDDINPVLDVTFDQVHIRDGDLVSAKPLIQIQLNDENAYLRLTDTTVFEVYLGFPDDFQPRRVWFSSGQLQFVPAAPDGANMAIALLEPDLTEDGLYLLKVVARDASGNASGDLDYAVHFKVITTAAISHFYNAPNPFSGSTRFYYTLTGRESPAFVSLQIFSEHGILVRDLTGDEIGPLRVGTHMSDFEWDGTDHTGARLPVGTYFYKWTIRDAQQKEYIHMTPYWESEFSTKGLGKIILIR